MGVFEFNRHSFSFFVSDKKCYALILPIIHKKYISFRFLTKQILMGEQYSSNSADLMELVNENRLMAPSAVVQQPASLTVSFPSSSKYGIFFT